MKKAALIALAMALLGASSPPPRATLIHVKKSTRLMEVFEGSTRIAAYSVAVGFGGAGPKVKEGDGHTPVGTYHVIKHMPSHLRIFMLLDYPNASDRARFEAAKASGTIPASATIGGDVGIHGEPPWAKPFKKATYTSQGCVVLEDAEIDDLARIVPDGTLVEIED